VEKELADPNVLDEKERMKEIDDNGRTPLHLFAEIAQKRTHYLADVGVRLVCDFLFALQTKDNYGETPLEIARRTHACADVIGLLSQTPESIRALGGARLSQLYAPVTYWRNMMVQFCQQKSWDGLNTFVDAQADELVVEVLQFGNNDLLREVSIFAQEYTDSLAFLVLRIVHRTPQALGDTKYSSFTMIQIATRIKACKEVRDILTLTPKYIKATPFPTLLRRFLPPKYEEIYGNYNTACSFIKHMKYDKAELVKVEAVLKPARKCDVCNTTTTKACARCKTSYFCSAECQKSAWKKHKKMCRAPTGWPASEADLRALHKGMLLLNRCIQEPGAGDGPTSEVLSFLRPKSERDAKQRHSKSFKFY